MGVDGFTQVGRRAEQRRNLGSWNEGGGSVGPQWASEVPSSEGWAGKEPEPSSMAGGTALTGGGPGSALGG